MYRLQSGDLRERINVQSYSELQSSTGVVSRTWATDNTRWASIKQLSGNEAMAHQGQQGEAVYEIVMRYYPSLTTDMRFTRGSEVYHIRSVDNHEQRNHVTVCICTREVS